MNTSSNLTMKNLLYGLLALLRTIRVLFDVLPRALLRAVWWTPPPPWRRPVSASTRRVVVLLHGVNQKASIWAVVVDELLAAIPPDCAVYAPFFDHADPLSALAAVVLNEVEPHVARGLELTVVGMSNGGRIAMHLEEMLPGHTVVLVGAPVRGTRWLEILPDWLLRLRLDRHLIREMRAHQFVRSESTRILAFAADWDEMVFPPRRCAPDGCTAQVLRGHMHTTMWRSREVLDAIVQNKK